MIHAILLHIVLLHAQMTLPWVGVAAQSAPPPAPVFIPWILRPGTPLVLKPGQPLVLFQ